MDTSTQETSPEIMEPRLWKRGGWTARVIKNEGDDGWAVEMIKEGQDEPALVAPWTMGRDKKNPKPLDQAAFITWVKTASEVLLRHEQQRRAALHKSLYVTTPTGQWVEVTLDIIPDEQDPHAVLCAVDRAGTRLGQGRMAPTYKLTVDNALRWLAGGMTSSHGE